MFMASLADVVAERRRAMKRTQRQVAKEVGISAGYLGMIEAGKVGIPSPDVMASLARVLGMPENELLQSVGYMRVDAVGGVDVGPPESTLLRLAALPTKQARLVALADLPRVELEALVLLMQDLFSTTTPELLKELIQQRDQDQ